MRANHAHQSRARLFSHMHVAVRLRKVEPHIQIHYARSLLSFARSLLNCAARSHLAARHIEHARAVAQRFQLEQRASDRQLSVVRVRKDRQRVKLYAFCAHRRKNFPSLLSLRFSPSEKESQKVKVKRQKEG